jgi:Ni,Fe-hydrogenase III small subunit
VRLVPRKGGSGSGHDGALSPNGRLLAMEGPDSTRIVETASGEEMLVLPGVSARSFTWLDARTAYAASPTGEHGWLLDFQQGRQFPLDQPKGTAVRAAKAPDADDQYVLFTSRSVARVQVVRFGAEAGLRRLKERPIDETPYDAALAGVTADGKMAFSAQGVLSFTALNTLETTRFDLDPFVPTQAVATPDADQIILTGAMTFEPDRPLQYLYRISSRKLARIETGKPAATRYVYIPSLRRLGLLADRKLTLVHSLPVGPEQPLAKWLAQASADAGQFKLEAALRAR